MTAEEARLIEGNFGNHTDLMFTVHLLDTVPPVITADTKAAKERADYPKLHKKNQFNPKKYYNDNFWVQLKDKR